MPRIMLNPDIVLNNFDTKKYDPGSASLVIGALGLAHNIMSTQKQAGASKKAAKERQASLRKQEKIASVKAARERVQNIRAARKQRASIVAGAAGGGVLDSSGASIGSGNVVSQLAGNLAFSQNIQGLGGEASALNVSAAGHASDAASFGAQAGIGATIFGNAERIGGIFSSGGGASTATPRAPSQAFGMWAK